MHSAAERESGWERLSRDCIETILANLDAPSLLATRLAATTLRDASDEVLRAEYEGDLRRFLRHCRIHVSGPMPMRFLCAYLQDSGAVKTPARRPIARYVCGSCGRAIEDVAECKWCPVRPFPWMRATGGPVLVAVSLFLVRRMKRG